MHQTYDKEYDIFVNFHNEYFIKIISVQRISAFVFPLAAFYW